MSAPPMDTVMHRIGELQAQLPAGASLLIGVAALGAVTLSAVWMIVRHVSVIAHEGAHAVMGSGTGQQITSLRLNRDGTGATYSLSRQGRGSDIAVAFIGYLGPSLFGLGAAKLISIGHIVAVLWLGLLALAIVLVTLRTWFGVTSVILTGGLLYLIARYAAVGAQEAVAYGIAWFLLLSGVRGVLEDGSRAADAGYLRQVTHIPRGLWSLLWLAGSVAALIIGGSLLT
jgi:hypothetical protein